MTRTVEFIKKMTRTGGVFLISFLLLQTISETYSQSTDGSSVAQVISSSTATTTAPNNTTNIPVESGGSTQVSESQSPQNISVTATHETSDATEDDGDDSMSTTAVTPDTSDSVTFETTHTESTIQTNTSESVTMPSSPSPSPNVSNHDEQPTETIRRGITETPNVPRNESSTSIGIGPTIISTSSNETDATTNSRTENVTRSAEQSTPNATPQSSSVGTSISSTSDLNQPSSSRAASTTRPTPVSSSSQTNTVSLTQTQTQPSLLESTTSTMSPLSSSESTTTPSEKSTTTFPEPTTPSPTRADSLITSTSTPFFIGAGCMTRELPTDARTSQDPNISSNKNSSDSSTTQVYDSVYLDATTTSPNPNVTKMRESQNLNIVFEGDCLKLQNDQSMMVQFSLNLFQVLSSTLNISKRLIKMKELTCSPMNLEIELREYEILFDEDTIKDELLGVSIDIPDEDRGIYKFNISSVSFLRDDLSVVRTGILGDIGIVDTVVMSIAALLFAFLLTVGVVFLLRECYKRNRGDSFHLKDSPVVGFKMNDFTLLKIPRPKMIYRGNTAEESKTQPNSLYSNGQDAALYDTNMNTDSHNTSLEQIRVHRIDHKSGLLVGVTAYNDLDLTTDDSTSRLVDSRGKDHVSLGTENPGFVGEEESKPKTDDFVEIELTI